MHLIKLPRFLLARFQIESLAGATNQEEVETALENLPNSIFKVYETAIRRIDSQSSEKKELARSLIAWVVFSCRPMSSIELRHALAVKLGDEAPNLKRLRSIEMILSVSAGLIIQETNGDIIRSVHETAREFFRDRIDFWDQNPQIYLAKTCITCLLFQVPVSESMSLRKQLFGQAGYAGINFDRFLEDASPPFFATISNFDRFREEAFPPFSANIISSDRFREEASPLFYRYASNFWPEHLRHVENECSHEAMLLLTR